MVEDRPAVWVHPEDCSALCHLVLDNAPRKIGNEGPGSIQSCQPSLMRRRLLPHTAKFSRCEDERVKDQSALGARRQRPQLPDTIFLRHVAPFLRFEAPMPNMLYVFGGRHPENGKSAQGSFFGITDSVEMFDTWRGRWVSCPAMPLPRAGSAAVTTQDGCFLIIGGYDDRGPRKGVLSSCDKYDPVTQHWVKDGTSRLRRARWGHGCTVLNGLVYAVGGCSAWLDHQPQPSLMETLRSAEVYDSTRDQWSACGQMQLARSGVRVVTVCGRYVAAVGGCVNVFGAGSPCTPTVELYDPAVGHWFLLGPQLLQARTCAAVVAIDDTRLAIVAGEPVASVARSSLEVYVVPKHLQDGGEEEHAERPEQDERVERAETIVDGGLLDMSDWRRGCQASMLQLPAPGASYPICTRPCVVVAGGECLERVDQELFLSVYDVDSGEWRESGLIPPAAAARTAMALCVGVGHVSH